MNSNSHHIFILLMLFMLISRMQEMYFSRKNEKQLLKNFKVQLAQPYEHYVIYLFHTLWFLVLFIEVFSKKEIAVGYEAFFCYLLLAIAQILRVESMSSLGPYWTTKIYIISKQHISFKGIYRYWAHPSYLAVILEFFAVPYLFNAYWTFYIFFPLNLILIANRIRLESKITGRLFL